MAARQLQTFSASVFFFRLSFFNSDVDVMSGIRARWDKFRKRLLHEDVRIPVQTASAVLLAYIASSVVDPANVSWGVFSALFVVQASIGGTVGAAFGRMAGAILGAIVAVLLVVVLGDGGWRSALALVISVGLMSVLTVRWPILAYGLVTATIIVVAPGFALVEDAVKKVLAIVIGSTCGMVAAFAVLPVSACRSEQEYLAAALRACGDFIVDCSRCLVDGKAGKDGNADRPILKALEGARDMSRQARIEERSPVMRPVAIVETLLPEVERFRYTLTLLDRFSDAPISGEPQDRLKAALMSLAEKMRQWLGDMATALEAGKGCNNMAELWQQYKEFSDQIDGAVDQGPLQAADKERLLALKSAFYSVLSNMTSLTEQTNLCRTGEHQAA